MKAKVYNYQLKMKGTKMLNEMQELERISAQKKELTQKQKEIEKKLEATKEQRKLKRSTRSKCRTEVKPLKAQLRSLTSSINASFSSGDVQEVNQLADNIMEIAAELTATIRKFADASEQPEFQNEETNEGCQIPLL